MLSLCCMETTLSWWSKRDQGITCSDHRGQLCVMISHTHTHTVSCSHSYWLFSQFEHTSHCGGRHSFKPVKSNRCMQTQYIAQVWRFNEQHSLQRGSYLVQLCLDLHHICLHIINASPAERTQSHTVNHVCSSVIAPNLHKPEGLSGETNHKWSWKPLQSQSEQDSKFLFGSDPRVSGKPQHHQWLIPNNLIIIYSQNDWLWHHTKKQNNGSKREERDESTTEGDTEKNHGDSVKPNEYSHPNTSHHHLPTFTPNAISSCNQSPHITVSQGRTSVLMTGSTKASLWEISGHGRAAKSMNDIMRRHRLLLRCPP